MGYCVVMGVLTFIAAAVTAGAAAPEPAGSIFDLRDDRVLRIVVTTSANPPTAEPSDGMIGQLHGVLGVLKNDDILRLKGCEPPESSVMGRPRNAETACYLHVQGEHSGKVVLVWRAMDGYYGAEERSTAQEPSPRVELDSARFGELSEEWARYRGTFDVEKALEKGGAVFQIAQPYSVGRFLLDKTTQAERMGPDWEERAERDLAEEIFMGRLPEGYDPKRPCGLVVWVRSAAGEGPPEGMYTQLDARGIVVVWAVAKGDRGRQEACQIALDLAATAERRWHIDPRRVYIGGTFEGAQTAAIMGACFPDVFRGTYAMGGFAFYREVGAAPALFRKPGLRLFDLYAKTPVIVSSPKGGYSGPSLTLVGQEMRKDGMKLQPVRLPGKEVSDEKYFENAIRTLDGGGWGAQERDRLAAVKAYDRYTAKYPRPGPIDPLRRKMLEAVIEAGPWTEAGWEAVRLLEGATDR
jgi:hypothetical protein